MSDLTRTLNGKLSEVRVHEVIHGRIPRNLNALANPEALSEFALPDWAWPTPCSLALAVPRAA